MKAILGRKMGKKMVTSLFKLATKKRKNLVLTKQKRELPRKQTPSHIMFQKNYVVMKWALTN